MAAIAVQDVLALPLFYVSFANGGDFFPEKKNNPGFRKGAHLLRQLYSVLLLLLFVSILLARWWLFCVNDLSAKI